MIIDHIRNCEDQDKMLQYVAFYLGLHYLAEESLRVHKWSTLATNYFVIIF